MNGEPNEWLKPGSILGIIGFIGALAAAWITLDGRTSRMEVTVQYYNTRLERIENKLDRIIENERDKRDGV